MNKRIRRFPSPSSPLVPRVRLGFCIGCLLVLLAGCARSTVTISFEGLCGLTQEQFATMDKLTLTQWVRQRYGVTPSRMGGGVEAGVQVLTYVWAWDTARGYASLHDGILAEIWLEDVQGGPTFGQVVDALGVPEAVSRDGTGWEDTVYRIGLEYPGLGFSVAESGVLAGYATEITLIRDMHVNTVDCYAPGSMEDVLKNAYLIPPENVPTALSHQLPWTGFGVVVSLERR